MSKVKRLCPVCRARPVEAPHTASAWCVSCGKSFDRATKQDDGTLLTAIMWGVRRAWRHSAQKRGKR